MQTVILYRYVRPDGGVTTSPVKPDSECTAAYRLIADEGKLLAKDGVEPTICTDVTDPDGWYEIDAPEEQEEIIDQ